MPSPFTLSYVCDHAQAAAESLEHLAPAAVAEFAQELPPAAAARVFAALVPQHAAASIALMAPPAAARMLDALEFADIVRHLYPLAAPARDAIVAHLQPTVRQGVVRALAFPPDSVGRAMDGRLDAFRPRTLVADALAEVAALPQPLPTCFVIDEAGRPIGVVTLGELLAAAGSAQLIDIMRPCPAPISALARLESVREAVLAEGDDHLPVVDTDQRLVGVLAKMDWARVMERDTGEGEAPELVSLWLSVANLFWQVGARVVGQAETPADREGAT